MLQIFGENVKLIRLVCGETQPVFGSRFNATKAMIVSYERGVARPNDLFINRLAQFAGVSVKKLMEVRLTEKDLKLDIGDMVYPAKEDKDKSSSNDYVKDELIRSLKSQVELLSEMLKSNLEKLSNGQLSIQANLFAHTLRSAERYSKGKEAETEQEMDKIDMYASRYLDRHLSSDKAARKIGKV
jgi:transcriptional regulator with XRE-family HTH domain